MNDFFSVIFNWLSSFYDQDWDNFLYEQGYYSYLGIILLVVFALVASIFYFAPTVVFNGCKKWFIFMGIGAVLTFAIALGVSDFWSNNATQAKLPTIDIMNEIGTSFISVFWGVVFFCILSAIFRKISTHNRNVPFN